jgi:hypothetical protein
MLCSYLSTELHCVASQNTVILKLWNKGFSLEATLEHNDMLADPEFWRKAAGPDEMYEYLRTAENSATFPTTSH